VTAFLREKVTSITSKFQNNVLTKAYKVGVIFAVMSTVEPRIKVQREPRRQLHQRLAWITAGNGVTERECHVLDLSSGGARISSDDAMDVRDQFELTLVRGHHKRELCEVVWRRGKTYGVKFLTLLPEVATVTDPTEASILPS
jgi:hypothetical protein